jgi:dihydroorotase
MELQGRVIGTIVRGNVAMWEAQLANSGTGEALRFAAAL